MPTQETFSVRVVRKRTVAQDVVSLELAHADGGPLPAWSAGAHVDVHLPGAAGGLVRQYSLYNAPHEQHRYCIAVLREPHSRGGSAALHDAVQEGDLLTISAPRNLFALHSAPRTLLLAGGIGITPLLSMAEQLHRSGAAFELHYCTRSPERTALAADIAAAPFAAQVQWHHDTDPDTALDTFALLACEGDDTHVYVCGPAGFIDAVVQTATNLGWPPERVHCEYFAAPAHSTATPQTFAVRLASTGTTYAIAPDTSIVHALRAHGIELPTACEQGVCGTCMTRVLEGEVEHRDMFLSEAQRACHDQFLPCCSRARSPLLVLDL